MSKEAIMKKITIKRFYYMEVILTAGWIVYLMKFYFFYKEAYFYVDKRLSLLLQVLSFFTDNWDKAFLYFVLGFLLMVVTLFVTSIIYLIDRGIVEKKQLFFFIVGLNSICFFSLFLNVLGVIFFILLILAATLVYVIFILGNVNWNEERRKYEVGDIIDMKGPFETKEEAQRATKLSFSKYPENAKFGLGEDIYVGTDNKYYADIYIEVLKK
ncbi:hypothetical protein [Enterococcus rivorum]|uniref:hypothetical protein n=1 Tax=Enterococcus rivorum TaxID=762845 RepID=UPI001112F041|nr:hypothetical protein [Enterococcus rivorum]MBP2100406.1 ABC-type multidrug transport system fused ATPase/permease subunit [Enterococcus rivorum]